MIALDKETPGNIARPECACPEKEIRKKTCVDGRIQYVWQCLCCGGSSAPLSKSTIRVPSLVPPFDESLREKWDAKWQQYREQKSDWDIIKNAAWWRTYDRYLLTPEWRDKRDKVLERDRHLCQGCFKNRAITAHHLTYAHVFHEFLFELVAVCATCHTRLHADRSQA